MSRPFLISRVAVGITLLSVSVETRARVLCFLRTAIYGSTMSPAPFPVTYEMINVIQRALCL